MTTKASSPGPVALCFLLHGCSELPWLLLALTSASASPMGSESTPPGVSLQISFLFSVIHFGVCVPSEPSLLHPPPDWGGGRRHPTSAPTDPFSGPNALPDRLLAPDWGRGL